MAEFPADAAAPTFQPLDDVQSVARLHHAYTLIRAELKKIIVGQDEVIDQLLIALFARGHVILEGVPGLAKTLMISSLSRCLGLQFRRVQFMPDLMPADITGTEVIQEDKRTGQRAFRFLQGPIFTNVLLADEINRTPPKTQAALLEAMQELNVTIGGTRHPIEPPFFVLATQNPIEQEGTYPLPEAQQDRFMFKVFVRYPGYDEEYQIAEQTTGGAQAELQTVLTQAEILHLQDVVRRVPAAPRVIHYTLELVRMTRPAPADRDGRAAADASGHPDFSRLDLVNRLVTFGAGPRAVQFLLLGAKARAVMNGRKYVSIADVRALAHTVLRHRIITNYAAEAEGYDADRIIDAVLEALPPGAADEAAAPAVADVLRQ
ncbi:MAG: MoxR family ATPase [Planctomycetes bacterium]|nr:MoxR family ATPase [Planctomycetota bacterium]